MSWYKIKILGNEVNWAAVVASGVLFIGLELWRRKYIAEKIKKDIRIALAEQDVEPQDDTQNNVAQNQSVQEILEDILDRI